MDNRKISFLNSSFWSSSKSTDDLVSYRESLSRRVQALEAEIRRLKDFLRFKDSVLLDEVEFLEEFLQGPASCSYESLRRRVSRLRGALERGKGDFS